MNNRIRFFGWLLFGMGSILVFLGLLAMIGLVHVRIDLFGINLDTAEERIAWIVSWMVAGVTGGLLLGLTNPEKRSGSV